MKIFSDQNLSEIRLTFTDEHAAAWARLTKDKPLFYEIQTESHWQDADKQKEAVTVEHRRNRKYHESSWLVVIHTIGPRNVIFSEGIIKFPLDISVLSCKALQIRRVFAYQTYFFDEAIIVFPSPIQRQNVSLVLKVINEKTIAALKSFGGDFNCSSHY